MFTRIVVPLDGSDIAETAIPQAENMATLTNAPIHLVRIVDFSSRDMSASYGMMTDISSMSVLLEDEDEAANEYLAAMAKRVAEQGFRVSREVRRGAVASQLIALAEPGDLLVMASHGRSGAVRWFLGSIAEEVVRRVSVPVLLVKASAKPDSKADRTFLREPLAAAR